MKTNKGAILVLNLTLCVIFTQIDQAQLLKNYGFKAGVTSSGISVRQQYYDLGRRTGMNIGVFAEWLNSQYLSIVTEINYNQRGFIEEMSEENNAGVFIQRVKANTRLDYLSIPLFAKLQLPLNGMIPYIVAGPRIDFLLNRSVGVFRFSWATAESPLAKEYRSQSVGGTIGLGIETDQLAPLPIFLEVHYDFDVTNSAREIPMEVYNNSIDVSVGVKIK